MTNKQEGLKDFFALFTREQLQPLTDKKVVWIQAVSLGEAKGVFPLIKELKKNPQIGVVISVSSKAGFFWAQKNIPADLIIYSPLDFLLIVKRAFSRINPKVFVITESGFWPNLIFQAKKHKIFTLLIQGRVSQKSWKWYRLFFSASRQIFSSFDLISMQENSGYEKMQRLGIKAEKIFFPGNIKFDLLEIVTEDEKNKIRDQFNINDQNRILVGASTHQGEEEIILEAFLKIQKEYPQIILILAPRRMERIAEVERMLTGKGLNFHKRSNLLKEEKRNEAIIVLDTIGELIKFYSFSDLIFVGGSLVPCIGGHSLIEPLAFGKIPFHGPFMENHQEIKNILQKKGLSIEVKNGTDLAAEGIKFFRNYVKEKELASLAIKFISENQGASQRIAELILNRLH